MGDMGGNKTMLRIMGQNLRQYRSSDACITMYTGFSQKKFKVLNGYEINSSADEANHCRTPVSAFRFAGKPSLKKLTLMTRKQLF